MRKSAGLTEPVWSSLSEDQRLTWKYFSRTVAGIGAFFVVKTGNLPFDWVLGIITTVFLVIAIETQRSYSKLGPQLRKGSVRVAISLGSAGVALLGAAMYLQIGLYAGATVFLSDIAPRLNSGANGITKAILLVAFVVAGPVAMVHVFRQLDLAELLYRLPRRGLKRLFIFKEPKAESFAQFALIELATLVACLTYASTIATIFNFVREVSQAVPVK